VAPHVVVALSGHGFGHIGQTAPVIRALRERVPDLHVTLRTSAPTHKLKERFGSDIMIDPAQVDIGVTQTDALHIQHAETALAYQNFHEDWDRKVEREAQALRALTPHLLLANVPYLPLAAALRVGIPAVAMSSLNWFDIYNHLYGDRPEAESILMQMCEAYSAAQVFLKLEPGMPMASLPNTLAIGPIAQIGHARREEIAARLHLAPDERLVVLSLGGMEMRPPTDAWPELPGLCLVVPDDWRSRRSRTVSLEKLGLSFLDVLWSCDALITKPGYGSFAEAACAGIPVLYVERADWPEASHLIDWLERKGRCAPITTEQWLSGDIAGKLNELSRIRKPPAVRPTGVDQAVDAILACVNWPQT